MAFASSSPMHKSKLRFLAVWLTDMRKEASSAVKERWPDMFDRALASEKETPIKKGYIASLEPALYVLPMPV